MKRIFSLLSALLFLALCGCSKPLSSTEEQQGEPLRGIWIAYYELDFHSLSEADFRKAAEDRMNTLAGDGYNAVFCHVRPFCDAIYPSKIFPWSNADDRSLPQGINPGYDPLEIIITKAHSAGIQLHAWINPYRVATGLPKDDNPYSHLAESHPVRHWMADEDPTNNTAAIAIDAEGGREIYLNPAHPLATKLIADGVREILDNYAVDGIHFDDYFYPTADPAFDKISYDAYVDGGGSLSLADWRRSNVSAMVSTVYAIAHQKGSIFGISPAAAISPEKDDRNFQKLYADIYLWMERAGYIDYIMPQLYFGYDYPKDDFKFPNLLAAWSEAEKHPTLKLYIGLGAYKQGREDAGSDEWQRRSDIISRQIADSLQQADGYVIFSYNSIYKQ